MSGIEKDDHQRTERIRKMLERTVKEKDEIKVIDVDLV